MSDKTNESGARRRRLGKWEERRLTLRIAIRNQLEVADALLKAGRSEGYVLARMTVHLGQVLALEDEDNLLRARVIDPLQWLGPLPKKGRA